MASIIYRHKNGRLLSLNLSLGAKPFCNRSILFTACCSILIRRRLGIQMSYGDHRFLWFTTDRPVVRPHSFIQWESRGALEIHFPGTQAIGIYIGVNVLLRTETHVSTLCNSCRHLFTGISLALLFSSHTQVNVTPHARVASQRDATLSLPYRTRVFTSTTPTVAPCR